MSKNKGTYYEALEALQQPTWIKVERKLSAFDKRAAAGAVLKCGNSFDISRLAQSILKKEDAEHMLVFCLDAINNVKHIARVSTGGLSSLSLAQQDVLRYPILAGSKAFVMAHNHPSGDPTPSGCDIRMTRKIAESAKIMDLQLIDHVVVAHERCASMLELGHLE